MYRECFGVRPEVNVAWTSADLARDRSLENQMAKVFFPLYYLHTSAFKTIMYDLLSEIHHEPEYQAF